MHFVGLTEYVQLVLVEKEHVVKLQDSEIEWNGFINSEYYYDHYIKSTDNPWSNFIFHAHISTQDAKVNAINTINKSKFFLINIVKSDEPIHLQNLPRYKCNMVKKTAGGCWNFRGKKRRKKTDNLTKTTFFLIKRFLSSQWPPNISNSRWF